MYSVYYMDILTNMVIGHQVIHPLSKHFWQDIIEREPSV